MTKEQINKLVDVAYSMGWGFFLGSIVGLIISLIWRDVAIASIFPSVLTVVGSFIGMIVAIIQIMRSPKRSED
ncbi:MULTISPECIES: hypothetical protein [Spirulina sp. CCY15215]|uniref:hypothetical protein n=1 Tax=Spirulina sp. CCY15215 TaxID=2767591 RepID=UPI00194E9BDF|nr:hypothetical protein [Spirulina major]